jgi:lysophospholipase L1-like esterase
VKPQAAVAALVLVPVLALALVASPCFASEPWVPNNDVRAFLRDWPNLARYRDENAKLAAPAAGERRVVFLGDSITDGWGREAGEFFPGKPYLNRGISGQTTPQMLLRLRQDVIALKPAALVLLAGTNDIAGNTGPATLEQIEANLASIAELARAHGIRLVLATLLPGTDAHGPQTGARPPEKIAVLNAWIRDYCQAGHCTLLDYHAAMVGEDGLLRPDLSDDGLHPNATGYALMAPLAQAAIDRAREGKNAGSPGKRR